MHYLLINFSLRLIVLLIRRLVVEIGFALVIKVECARIKPNIFLLDLLSFIPSLDLSHQFVALITLLPLYILLFFHLNHL